MKIGVDIRCLMEERYSGISEYTYNLLKELFALDPKNQYFLFYNSRKAVKRPAFDFPNVTFRGFRYPNKIFNLSLRFLKLIRLDKLIGGADVFLVPNLLFLNLSSNCRKILIVHDLSFELYPEFFTLKARLWHKLISPQNLCRQADVIIAVSQNTKNDIIKIYDISPEKIKVVNPGISGAFFRPAKTSEIEKIRKKYNLADKFIFYLGNLEPRKNVEALIAAFEKINQPDWHLVIAGGQAWKYKNIYKLWQKSPARQRIKFLGYVAAVDKPALYAAAGLFVYPSIYEGFGLPPVEAMACGCPVITSFSSSLVEAVGQAGLLVDPNNYQELAETINQILAEPELWKMFKERGLARSQNFHWQKAAAEILRIIEAGN
ncbi:MAG: hypothetical protein A3J65_03505 [Candidatus Buchananbacteria bacterium RIFCSPHIGHO2_02_FULL_45_11b]|uniref:Glycosyl transferase family 1 domain-containing protein n=3 Tax=Candidatus Buchananiibacteriota TaxID=1817903 RepID=A0A1G1Y7F9_9BACT|nr:MAG: hypothetical protein A2663_04515 [Candidatus Buchananbacteria bacterium RIFCSPHIGHO2_01_FULL_46_12]OGY49827.1 MAG: hypothetical protein A3J65_03505 [Candidatus Buchananbacteria bacterium RIFCSPHIGHO2_02_FULL_45_11b]OGY57104.1 MAG: hypothetical protein A3H67_02055 [Candidatus Buchananbacteria bacterium RIFCSPLOWO2_02_FULL_46_11b]